MIAMSANRSRSPMTVVYNGVDRLFELGSADMGSDSPALFASMSLAVTVARPGIQYGAAPALERPDDLHCRRIEHRHAVENTASSFRRIARHTLARPKPETVNILGVPVSVIDMTTALAFIDHWIEARRPQFVCLRDVHGVMACQDDPALLEIHRSAGLVAPDGMPLVWLGRLMGFRAIRRVSGPDLMPALCERSLEKGYRHFFYGGAPGVPERLAEKLGAQFPGLTVVGTHSPPFRATTTAEDTAIVREINESGADIVWIGLSTPKQEHWMAAHLGRLDAPIMLGVGAAFDVHAGEVRRAPAWMQRSGLEWLFRLMSEPRRLWRRYVILAPKFLFLAICQILGLRRYE
jgi:N-acetylglucosaminyldiphosphoundecaprenol N-acetyl-beta-D-mannosaminyltransferase